LIDNIEDFTISNLFVSVPNNRRFTNVSTARLFHFSARFLHSPADDVDLDYQGLTVLASYFHRFNL
jgi:hypothetical protein